MSLNATYRMATLPKLLSKYSVETLCYIVGIAATIGRAFSGIGQPPVMGVVADALIQQGFHSRETITTIYFASIVLAAFLMPLAGYLFDSWGARRTGLLVILILSACCFLFAYGNIHNSAFLVLLMFVSIRFFGQGALNLISANMINQWWTQRRRLVQGWSSCIYSFAMFAILPTVTIWLDNKYGWQDTLGILASLILCIMTPIWYLFYLDDIHMDGLETLGAQRYYPMNNEEYEMNESYWHSDDDDDDEYVQPWEENISFLSKETKDTQKSPPLFLSTSLNKKTGHPVTWQPSWHEAIRCCYFWKFSWCCFSWGFLTTGLFFHWSNIYTNMNVSSTTTTVSHTLFLIGVFSAIFSLFPAYVDTCSLRPLSIAMFFLGLSFLLINFVHWHIVEWLLGITLGGVMGMMNVYFVVLLAEWFGTKHIGMITGINQAITQLGSALGPLVLLRVIKWTDSYFWTLVACSLWPFLTIVWLHY